jgi:hypothetical protein
MLSQQLAQLSGRELEGAEGPIGSSGVAREVSNGNALVFSSVEM